MKITFKKFTRPAGIAVIVATALAVTGTSVSLASENTAHLQQNAQDTAAHSMLVTLSGAPLGVDREILQTRLAHDAGIASTAAQQVIASSAAVTDVTALTGKVQALTSLASLSSKQIVVLIDNTKAETVITAANAATEVARQAAEAAAAAAAKEAAIAATRDPNAARALGAQIAVSGYGWGAGEFSCLDRLWTKESNWRYNAYNAGGGATGIPQSLPGSKMAAFGADYMTNPETQIRWGLDYIQRSYGSPCSAWNHSVARGWY